MRKGCRYAGCRKEPAVRKTFWNGRVYEVRVLGACFMHLLYYRKQAQKYLKSIRANGTQNDRHRSRV